MEDEEYEPQEYLPGQSDGYDADSGDTSADVPDEGEETVETAGEPIAEAPVVRETVNHRPFTPTNNEALNRIAEEYGDPNLAALFQQAIRHETRHMQAAQVYANTYSQQLAAEAPELYAQDRDLAHYRASLPDELHGTPLGEVFVALGPELQEVQRTGDMRKFKADVAARLGRQEAPAPKPAPRAMPAAERIPSPTGGGGGGRPAREDSRPVSKEGTFARIFNISEEQARDTIRRSRRGVA